MRIRIAAAVTATGVAVALAAVLAGCGASPGPAAGKGPTDPPTTTTTVPATTTTTSTTSTTTTTTTLPAGRQPSAEGAASAFLDSWVAGDRADAGKVATPAAVSELFVRPYQGQPLVPRGCSSAEFPPVVCSYGPEGGASPTNNLYEISLAYRQGGWYVAKVVVEQG
jgi:hypothetical protein